MTAMQVEISKAEIGPSSFKFHEFVDEIGDIKFNCHIIKMEDSLYLWIGDFTNKTLSDLSVAFQSELETPRQPIATKIIGSVVDTASLNIAKRLTKKLGKPVYVSFNIQVDNLSLPRIEKRIHEEFKVYSELFLF